MTAAELLQAIHEYLDTRRAMGYKLQTQEILLRSFAQYAAARAHRGPLTCALMEDWARTSRRSTPYSWTRRLSVLRPFARYLAAIDPETQVPPSRVFGPAHRRVPPCVLTPGQLADMLKTAEELAHDGRRETRAFATLVGLLACTGLRVAEALRLNVGDVDLDTGLLHIRQTKFGKSRVVPLHPTARAALARYARGVCGEGDPPFLQSAPGVRLSYRRVRTLVERVRRILGWDRLPAGARPTLRALRHTFTCRRLLSWYEDGPDPSAHIHALSTYLGHGKVSDTYWYLSSLPPLMACAATRFHGFAHGQEA